MKCFLQGLLNNDVQHFETPVISMVFCAPEGYPLSQKALESENVIFIPLKKGMLLT